MAIDWLDNGQFPYWPEAVKHGDPWSFARWLIREEKAMADLLLADMKEFKVLFAEMKEVTALGHNSLPPDEAEYAAAENGDAVPVIAAAAPSRKSARASWMKLIDPESSNFFYFHPETGRSEWAPAVTDASSFLGATAAPAIVPASASLGATAAPAIVSALTADAATRGAGTNKLTTKVSPRTNKKPELLEVLPVSEQEQAPALAAGGGGGGGGGGGDDGEPGASKPAPLRAPPQKSPLARLLARGKELGSCLSGSPSARESAAG